MLASLTAADFRFLANNNRAAAQCVSSWEGRARLLAGAARLDIIADEFDSQVAQLAPQEQAADPLVPSPTEPGPHARERGP